MNESKFDGDKALFLQLVSLLGMSAMQQLGKLPNPLTGKTETNLAAAQATIDTLDMLEAKTKNNLNAAEEKFLKDTLASLKLNFVETKDEEERKPHETLASTGQARDKPKESKPQTEDKPQDKAEPKSDKEPPKDPKFHKSYD